MSFLLLTLALLVAPTAADPLAPARDGAVQCYSPDPARKTCSSIAAYRFRPDGSVLNEAQVVVSPAPLAVMRATAPMTLRDGAVCGGLGDVETASFTISGRPASRIETEALRQGVNGMFSALIGAEICTRFVQQGGAWVAQAEISGQRRPELDQMVSWIGRDEGYKVAP